MPQDEIKRLLHHTAYLNNREEIITSITLHILKS